MTTDVTCKISTKTSALRLKLFGTQLSHGKLMPTAHGGQGGLELDKDTRLGGTWHTAKWSANLLKMITFLP